MSLSSVIHCYSLDFVEWLSAYSENYHFQWGGALGVCFHIVFFLIQLQTSTHLDINILASRWLRVLAQSLPKSGSLTVFMELCIVVSVVSHLSLRPCKDPHHRAAKPRCSVHKTRTHTSVEQQHVEAPNLCPKTGREEGWMSCFRFVFFGSVMPYNWSS